MLHAFPIHSLIATNEQCANKHDRRAYIQIIQTNGPSIYLCCDCAINLAAMLKAQVEAIEDRESLNG